MISKSINLKKKYELLENNSVLLELLLGFKNINQEIPITSRVYSNHDSFTILFQWKLHERNRRCPWRQ
jgi:hypothetical protein